MDPVAGRGGAARVAVWVAHLSAPMAGLWLLVARPGLDGHWQHEPAHFWLVLLVALVSLALAIVVNQAARRRSDTRLLLVALSFLVAAAFLGLHAVATPQVVLDARNTGFVYASPVGLTLAAVFAAASALDLPAAAERWLLRWSGRLRAAVLTLAAAWAVVSLTGLPPLDRVPGAGESTPAILLAAVGVILFGYAAVRYYLLHRRRRAVMLLSVVTAYVLLAEAAVAMAAGTSWHASWWLWHALMAAGFGYVAYSAWVQYRNEGAAAGLFAAVGRDETVRRLRADYGAALEGLVDALRSGEQGALTEGRLAATTERVARRFELTDGQAAVLGRAAGALAAERDQIRKLDALVAIGQDARVMVADFELLRGAVHRVASAFGGFTVRVGLVEQERLVFPPVLAAGAGAAPVEVHTVRIAQAALARARPEQRDGVLYLPFLVKGHPAGVLIAARGGPIAERDAALLTSLAAQIAISLENARLYRQLDVLFRQYMSPDVVTALVADPSQAALGGAVIEVTSLFADLRGFTTFSERSSPGQIVDMLNCYFDVATRAVLGENGTVVQFVGDALMALFNAPARQPDHALRAARAALTLQHEVDRIAAARPDWPRFRVGVNTGEALVGNIGGEALRNFNAMGDAVNVAARLETQAAPGQVVIGAATRDRIGDRALVTPLGDLMVKGRLQPVPAFVLHGLRGESPWHLSLVS
ncbi:adenylate/guanylate cyclase domain-containing protein [Actinoplanes sp. M2I2]|uniref:adenylate/guanylate cyclase domain-containing protein n=1 Tax=Actinoplanes sp. M2I2 TaxID=1734444 RepID=UPI00202116DC|nr:adenylate/guanylate cyclase domain-containing protein [Actinoplanes sp. M2I2]